MFTVKRNPNPEPETPMPTITFTAGCGGSGKSTVLRRMYPELEGVDPDVIKTTIAGYDPLHPERTHKASSEAATREFYRRLSEGNDFYLDGTGRNVEKYVGLISAAKAAGYRTRILYVHASLETCLTRNARRSRKVPVEVIHEAFISVKTSMGILRHYVDSFVDVENED